MNKMPQGQAFSFGAAERDAAALSALACEMFAAAANAQAGARVPRAVSVNLDVLSKDVAGPLTGNVRITKSTASAMFLSAELTAPQGEVVRATALYGFVKS